MRWPLAVLAVLALAIGAALVWRPDSPVATERVPSPSGAPTESRSVGEIERPARRRVADAAARAAEPDAGPAAEPEIRVLRILGVDDRPLEGVPVSPFFGDSVFTDAAGEVALREAAYRHELSTPLSEGQLKLDGPLTILRVPDARPVEVRLVDLETGMPLVAEWPDGRSSERAGWVRPGGAVGLHLPFRVPDGYAWPEQAERRWPGGTSRYADRFVATFPVAREVPLTVSVTAHDGSPAPRARVTARMRDGRRRLQARAVADEQGIARVTGLPFRRREQVTLDVVWYLEFEPYGREQTFFLGDTNVPCESAVELPEEATDDDAFQGPSASGTIGIGGGPGRTPPPAAKAALRVQVVRRDGSPAGGAMVHVLRSNRDGRTDDQGVVVLDDLPAGDVEVMVLETGIVPTSALVRLVEGRQSTVELREAPGRTMTVRVVDPRGAPLPAAEIVVAADFLWRWDHAHVVNGTQALPILTDASGRVRLEHLPAESVRIRAVYGSRSVGAALGAVDVLELTMPDAASD